MRVRDRDRSVSDSTQIQLERLRLARLQEIVAESDRRVREVIESIESDSKHKAAPESAPKPAPQASPAAYVRREVERLAGQAKGAETRRIS